MNILLTDQFLETNIYDLLNIKLIKKIKQTNTFIC